MKKTLVVVVVLVALAGVYAGLARMGYAPRVCALCGKFEGRHTVDRKEAVNGKFFVITREFETNKGRIFQVSEAQFAEIKAGLIYDANNMKGWKLVDREK